MAVVVTDDTHLPGSLIQPDAVIEASPDMAEGNVKPVNDMPVALPEAASERRPTRGNRFAGTLKKVAKAISRSGRNVVYGRLAPVNTFNAGAPQGPGSLRGEGPQQLLPEPGFSSLLHEQSPMQRCLAQVRRTTLTDREQRRRGRPLTEEEQQLVINGELMRNRLLELGLEWVV
jgi:hypothetical protein